MKRSGRNKILVNTHHQQKRKNEGQMAVEPKRSRKILNLLLQNLPSEILGDEIEDENHDHTYYASKSPQKKKLIPSESAQKILEPVVPDSQFLTEQDVEERSKNDSENTIQESIRVQSQQKSGVEIVVQAISDKINDQMDTDQNKPVLNNPEDKSQESYRVDSAQQLLDNISVQTIQEPVVPSQFLTETDINQMPKNNPENTMVELAKINPENNTEKRNRRKGYDKVHCFYWNETDANRGSSEIGTCILEYLKKIGEDSTEGLDIIFYSDNYSGQQKNKFVMTSYMYAVSKYNIKSITHKLLIRGHTQNEGDNIHSLIEKEVKKNLKSSPIYSPHQYVTIIKNAKKTPPPFTVHELYYKYFIDLKQLQAEWGYNYSINKAGNNVSWGDIKVVHVKQEKPFSIYYKTSYKQKQYLEVHVRNKRNKMPVLAEIQLHKANARKIPLADKKQKDLKELIAKNLIPEYYEEYYNTLFS